VSTPCGRDDAVVRGRKDAVSRRPIASEIGYTRSVASEGGTGMRMGTKRHRGSRPRARYLVPSALALAAALGAVAALTSSAAQAVVQEVPKTTVEPRISGSPVTGATLTATHGDWSGTTPITFAYQWVRCPTSGGKSDGSDCATISGATTSAYVAGSGD